MQGKGVSRGREWSGPTRTIDKSYAMRWKIVGIIMRWQTGSYKYAACQVALSLSPSLPLPSSIPEQLWLVADIEVDFVSVA